MIWLSCDQFMPAHLFLKSSRWFLLFDAFLPVAVFFLCVFCGLLGAHFHFHPTSYHPDPPHKNENLWQILLRWEESWFGRRGKCGWENHNCNHNHHNHHNNHNHNDNPPTNHNYHSCYNYHNHSHTYNYSSLMCKWVWVVYQYWKSIWPKFLQFLWYLLSVRVEDTRKKARCGWRKHRGENEENTLQYKICFCGHWLNNMNLRDAIVPNNNNKNNKVNEYPWMVGLYTREGSLPKCGGSLINSK